VSGFSRTTRTSRHQSVSTNQLDDAGKRIFRGHAWELASHAPKASYALQMRFPVTEYVASLAWFAEAAWRRLVHRFQL